MGKNRKNPPKQKRRLAKEEKTRKLTKKGKLKHKSGDLRLISTRNVSFAVKQKKGGKWVKTSERKCNIHSVCDCVRRTDPAKMRRISNR